MQSKKTQEKTHVRTDETIPTLALRPRDAALALGIGARKLWAMTQSREIPHIRIGRAILYPITALEQWMAEKLEGRVEP